MRVLPLHEVRDEAKLEALIASMIVNGWQGRPVLAIDCGDYLQALTGSHRIAAAEAAEIEVETLTISQPTLSDDAELSELFSSLIDGGDEERIEALRALVERGAVKQAALDLMAQEK